MARAIPISIHVKRAAIPAASAVIALYFAYHALVGDFGLVAWLELEREKAMLEEQLASAQAERLELEHRVSLLRPESLDPDMLEERARETLSLAHPNDITIFRDGR
jgi:cell division protein FtsB